MIQEHWLLGVGLGRFWEHFEEYRGNQYFTRYPHNVLLEVFAELGVVGGGALILFLGSALATPVRWLRANSSSISSGHPLSTTLAATLLVAHAMVDLDLHAPANPVLLLILLAIAQRLDQFAPIVDDAGQRPEQRASA